MSVLRSPVILLLSLVLLVAGCKSLEERAEERYQSGLALIETGDIDRAIVELRSVFELDESHFEARRTLAELLLNEQNNKPAAYNQYLRLSEQYPDDAEIRIILAKLAFSMVAWDEFERHGARAVDLASDDPEAQAIDIVRDYREAVRGEDASARREVAARAEAFMEELPENELLRNVLIDNHLRDNEMEPALEHVEWLLERHPDDQRYLRQRLDILIRLQNFDAVEAQLLDMVERFPDNTNAKQTLLRFYMSRGQLDEAETFLRSLAEASDEVGPRIDLIRFVIERNGAEAGFAEIEEAIAAYPDEPRYKVLRATLNFSTGEREEAVREMEAVLEGMEPSEETNDIKVGLARMRLAMGNEVGARALVEEVLAQDATHPNALKMQAAWLIDADDTDGAIAGLRQALDRAPEDAEAMTLMAQAYSRAGNLDLARDFLALAVEASGNAPAETVRYARVLIEGERYLPAEDILLPALRVAPNNIELLTTLGQVYLGLEDLGRLGQVIDTLRRIDNPTARQAADALEAERINRQSGPEDALSFLEGVSTGDDATLSSKVGLVRARLGVGDAEGALTLARQLQEEEPENDGLKAILAAVEAANGNLDTAETLYRELLEQEPQQPSLWLQLSQLKQRQGDAQAARDVIAEGLEAMPEEPNMLWAQATFLERDGDIDGAIAIYEDLYAQNSSNTIIANNLASLISTYRDDPESLERAWVIARRLRETEVPAFQDTYGWIAHRRGESQEALPYLEAAAAGLSQEPLAHYHLAEVYLALGREDDALDSYRRTLETAGPTDTRAQIERARAQVQALSGGAGDQGGDTPGAADQTGDTQGGDAQGGGAEEGADQSGGDQSGDQSGDQESDAQTGGDPGEAAPEGEDQGEETQGNTTPSSD